MSEPDKRNRKDLKTKTNKKLDIILLESVQNMIIVQLYIEFKIK